MPVDSERVPEVSAAGERPSVELGDLRLLTVARWITSRLPGSSILDISSPSGLLAHALAEAGHEASVVTRRRAIADALPEGLSPSVQVHHAEVEELPFVDHRFGVVVCSVSELYAVSADRSVAELARVTSHDGCLILVLDADAPAGGLRVPETNELLLRYFAAVEEVARRDFVVSVMAPVGDHSPASPDEDLSGPGAPAFVVASGPTVIGLRQPVVAVHAADLGGWWSTWGDNLRRLREVEARAVAAEKATTDRPELVRQLFLSEQQLAAVFDRNEILEGQLGWVSGLKGELAVALEKLAVAESNAANLLQARVEIRNLNAEIARLHASNAEAHQAVQAMLASSSWKLTRPLRLIKRLSSR